MLILLLLTMLTTALARIEINFIVGKDGKDVKVDFFGSSEQTIHHYEKLEPFEIFVNDLYIGIKQYSDIEPERVFTYDKNTYPENNWMPVTAVLIPKSYRIVNIETYPKIIDNPEDIIEIGVDLPINFTQFGGVIVQSLQFTWAGEPDKPEFQEPIKFSVDLSAVKNILISNNFWGYNTFGSNNSHVGSIHVDEMVQIGIINPPYTPVNVSLWVKRYQIDIEVDYEVTLVGDLSFELNTFMGVHHGMFNIHQILRNLNNTGVYKTTQFCTITFDTEFDITVYDVNKNQPLPFQEFVNDLPNYLQALPSISAGTKLEVQLLFIIMLSLCWL